MEKEHSISLKNFVIVSVCGFAAFILIGLVFFQSNIFNLYSNKFIFTSLGFAGALVFASLLYRKTKDSLLFLAAVFLINLIISKNHLISFTIRDIVLFGSFWLSLYLYYTWYSNSSGKYKFIRALGLGVLTGILFLIAGIFLIFVNVSLERISIELVIQISLYYIQSGILIGLGLGLGFDFGEFLIIKNII
ncbi:MAG: hypothetical protein WCA84_11630 [Ignavibacteriaceae bacterium]